MIKVVGLLMAAAAAGYWMFRGRRSVSSEMSGDTSSSERGSGDNSMLPGKQPEYASTPSPSVAASPRRDDTVSTRPQRSVADYPGSQSSG